MIHPNRKLAAAGLTVQPSRLAEPPASAREQGSWPKLLNILPPQRVISCFEHEIVIPASTDFGPSATPLSAWWGIESINVPDETGEQLAWAGYDLELLPTDSQGSANTPTGGAASSTGWGATNGLGAAIVIGVNLPITRKTWSFAPAYVPGLEGAAAGLDLSSPKSGPEYHAWTFPTGKYSDTTPNKLYLPKSFLPSVVPLPNGARLDVALVVRRSQLGTVSGGRYTSGVVKYILGSMQIRLHLLRSRQVYYTK
ncbi:MAG: hypothetical protein ACKVW3_11780 [Phycisphaerales bacterium]